MAWPFKSLISVYFFVSSGCFGLVMFPFEESILSLASREKTSSVPMPNPRKIIGVTPRSYNIESALSGKSEASEA